MVSSDFRAEARRKLSGKWGKSFLIILAYLFFSFLLGLISGILPDSLEDLIRIVLSILEVPLAYGLVYNFYNLYNDKETSSFGFLSLGFGNFGRAWSISLRVLLKLIVPFLAVVASVVLIVIGFGSSFFLAITSSFNPPYYSAPSVGLLAVGVIGVVLYFISSILLITQSYYYAVANIVAIEHPELSPKNCVEKSKELMTNNRAKYFCLQLSFIGWAILATLTLGIGYLWLLPYIQIATLVFYSFVNKKKDCSATVEIVEH